MCNWLLKLLGIRKTAASDEEGHVLRNEIQTLKLELYEKDTMVSNLRQELNYQRHGEIDKLSEKLSTFLEELMVDVSTPVTQLISQIYLFEIQSKPLQARDVLAVAKRFVHLLEDRGMKIEGTVEEIVLFDPNHHMPLSGRFAMCLGERVIIRLVGISYKGKTIRKAGVEHCLDV
jgi:hypothetical protein